MALTITEQRYRELQEKVRNAQNPPEDLKENEEGDQHFKTVDDLFEHMDDTSK